MGVVMGVVACVTCKKAVLSVLGTEHRTHFHSGTGSNGCHHRRWMDSCSIGSGCGSGCDSGGWHIGVLINCVLTAGK